MLLTKHELTEGEKKCLEEYEREKSPKPRKNLIRLVRHMNFANPLPDEKSWEYIFFDRQLNDAQVDFALKMKLRHPYTIKELATVEKMSVEDTAQMAYDLCYIGLLEYCNDPGKEDMVQLPVFAPGAMESTVMTKERTDRYPETAPAFLNYVLDLQKKVTGASYMGIALMRAIPVEQSIAGNTRYDFFSESRGKDISNRWIGVAHIKKYIEVQHQYGMKSMFYNLCFGAWKDADKDGVKAEWGLYKKNHIIPAKSMILPSS